MCDKSFLRNLNFFFVELQNRANKQRDINVDLPNVIFQRLTVCVRASNVFIQFEDGIRSLYVGHGVRDWEVL